MNPEMTPTDYMKRGQKIIDQIRAFKKAWSRISKASEFKESFKENFKRRQDWIDYEICLAWTRCHFEETPEKVLKDRKVEVAAAFADAMEILEAFN